MNHARWNIDYIHKKMSGERVPKAKSISQLVLEEKQRTQKHQESRSGTPDKIRRILKVDQAQLDELQ